MGAGINLTSEDAIDGGLRRIVGDHGRLDYLVVVTDPKASGPFLAVRPSEWQDSIAFNLTAAFLACRTAARLMVDDGFGRIVLVSSGLARTGAKFYSASTAAQAGLLGLARTLALEVAPYGVTVNVVSGPLPEAARNSKVSPLRRAVREADLVEGCLMLLSDEAGFITGQELRINGGELLW